MVNTSRKPGAGFLQEEDTNVERVKARMNLWLWRAIGYIYVNSQCVHVPICVHIHVCIHHTYTKMCICVCRYICRLPRWLSDKESASQCKRCRRRSLDHEVRKIPWRKKWQPTPVFLPGKFHGQRSLEGQSPQDR